MATYGLAVITFIGAVAGLNIPAVASGPLPLVIWHGLGDAFDSDGIRHAADVAKEVIPGAFVYNIRLADDGNGDRQASFFGNFTDQLQKVCDDIASHPKLMDASGINALGFSQGGQFLRAYVERCNNPPVKNLVTFGSQHNGISKFQSCAPTDWLCNAFQATLRWGVWSDFVQSGLVPAQYFRNPNELDNYLEHSNLLADINNERKIKNKKYARNMQTLDKFVMYIFDEDTTVIPKESGWFMEVNSTSGEKTKLQDRQIYKEDWIGLQQLDKKGALVFETSPGAHMHLADDLMKDVFAKYFAPRRTIGFHWGNGQDVEVQDILQ